MSLLNADHPAGIAYGDGYMQGDGSRGQVVKVAGDDLFAVNIDPTAKSFGLLMKDYKTGEMPGIYCGGGIYTTDVFTGVIAAGDDLMVGADGKLTKLVTCIEFVKDFDNLTINLLVDTSPTVIQVNSLITNMIRANSYITNIIKVSSEIQEEG